MPGLLPTRRYCQFGPTLTVDQVAQSIVELATGDGYDAPAYLLGAGGVRPVD